MGVPATGSGINKGGGMTPSGLSPQVLQMMRGGGAAGPVQTAMPAPVSTAGPVNVQPSPPMPGSVGDTTTGGGSWNEGNTVNMNPNPVATPNQAVQAGKGSTMAQMLMKGAPMSNASPPFGPGGFGPPPPSSSGPFYNDKGQLKNNQGNAAQMAAAADPQQVQAAAQQFKTMTPAQQSAYLSANPHMAGAMKNAGLVSTNDINNVMAGSSYQAPTGAALR